MKKVLIAGSINMDVVATSPRHPLPGETIVGSTLHFLPGGKGANQAVAAAKLRAETYLIGKLGADAFVDTLEVFLQSQEIQMSFVTRTSDAATGTALIVVAEGGENSIVVIPGANALLGVQDIEQVVIEPGDVLVSQFEISLETVKQFFCRGKAAGAVTILNPAPAIEGIAEVLQYTDIVVLNEIELAYYVEVKEVSQATLRAAADKLRHRPEQTIIVTLGAQGVFVLEGNKAYTIPGRTVVAIDTTGAGDCFVGALAAQLAVNTTLKDAIAYANAAASLSVQRLGAASSMPTREEVERAVTS